MLTVCCAIIYDAGPTFSQHWFIMSCLLDNFQNVPSNTRLWINVGLTLGQRRRRLTYIKPVLTERVVPTGLCFESLTNENVLSQRTEFFFRFLVFLDTSVTERLVFGLRSPGLGFRIFCVEGISSIVRFYWPDLACMRTKVTWIRIHSFTCSRNLNYNKTRPCRGEKPHWTSDSSYLTLSNCAIVTRIKVKVVKFCPQFQPRQPQYSFVSKFNNFLILHKKTCRCDVPPCKRLGTTAGSTPLTVCQHWANWGLILLGIFLDVCDRCLPINHETLNSCFFNVGPMSATFCQH